MGMDYKHSDDGELLRQFCDKACEEAFAEVVKRHQRLVLATARDASNGAAFAEDIAQAAFLLLARKAVSLVGKKTVAGWLHRTVRNLVREEYRATTRRKRREQTVGEILFLQQQTDRAAQVDQLGQAEAAAAVQQALDRLPLSYREPILLRYMEGLSEAAVASRLGLKPGTLSSRLSRGREMLQHKLTRRGLPLSLLGWLLAPRARGNTLDVTLLERLAERSVNQPVPPCFNDLSRISLDIRECGWLAAFPERVKTIVMKEIKMTLLKNSMTVTASILLVVGAAKVVAEKNRESKPKPKVISMDIGQKEELVQKRPSNPIPEQNATTKQKKAQTISLMAGKKKKAPHDLVQKMQAITIPSLDFMQADIEDALEFLVKAARQFDPDGKGVKIILQIDRDAVESVPPITLSVKNINLQNAINYVTALSGLIYRIDENVVMITQKPQRILR